MTLGYLVAVLLRITALTLNRAFLLILVGLLPSLVGPLVGLELMMRPRKIFRRFCGPRSFGCGATLKNWLKQTSSRPFRRARYHP